MKRANLTRPVCGIFVIATLFLFSGCSIIQLEIAKEFRDVYHFQYPKSDAEMEIVRPKVIEKLSSFHGEVRRLADFSKIAYIQKKGMHPKTKEETVEFDKLCDQIAQLEDEYEIAVDTYERAKDLVLEFNLSKEIEVIERQT